MQRVSAVEVAHPGDARVAVGRAIRVGPAHSGDGVADVDGPGAGDRRGLRDPGVGERREDVDPVAPDSDVLRRALGDVDVVVGGSGDLAGGGRLQQRLPNGGSGDSIVRKTVGGLECHHRTGRDLVRTAGGPLVGERSGDVRESPGEPSGQRFAGDVARHRWLDVSRGSRARSSDGSRGGARRGGGWVRERGRRSRAYPRHRRRHSPALGRERDRQVPELCQELLQAEGGGACDCEGRDGRLTERGAVRAAGVLWDDDRLLHERHPLRGRAEHDGLGSDAVPAPRHGRPDHRHQRGSGDRLVVANGHVRAPSDRRGARKGNDRSDSEGCRRARIAVLGIVRLCRAPLRGGGYGRARRPTG